MTRILLVSTSPKDPSIKDITELLQSVRIKYKMVSVRNISDLSKAKYLVVIFQNIQDFHRMEEKSREMLASFCTKSKVGILGFLPSGRWKADNAPLSDTNMTSPITVTDHLAIKNLSTTSHKSLRILKQNVHFREEYLHSNKWVRFSASDNSVVPIVRAQFQDGSSGIDQSEASIICVNQSEASIICCQIGRAHV